VRNPWSGVQATVIDNMGQQVVAPTTAAMLAVNAQQGRAYLINEAATRRWRRFA